MVPIDSDSINEWIEYNWLVKSNHSSLESSKVQIGSETNSEISLYLHFHINIWYNYQSQCSKVHYHVQNIQCSLSLLHFGVVQVDSQIVQFNSQFQYVISNLSIPIYDSNSLMFVFRIWFY